MQVEAEGKGVLISGCDSGFGHQVARDLHAAGFTVFAGCLDPGGPGGRLLNQLGQSGRPLHVLLLDVTNQDHVDSAVRYCHDPYQ